MKSHRKVELGLCVRRGETEVASVAIAGEISAWDMPIAASVRRQDDDAWRGALSLSLPPGIYAYKLIVDGEWTLDEDAARTRSESGRRNHVLNVGGTPEPLLFAPSRPWIAEMGRGGARIIAALRHGNGDSLAVEWQEPADGAAHVTPMSCVGREDEHSIFEARVPISSRRAAIRFVLENGDLIGDEDGAPLHWNAPVDSTPQWWHQAVIYTIFVDRFRPRALHPRWSRDPGPQKYAGGHLDGITQSLPSLAKMGVNLIYLTPVHVGANCHRYDMVDPFCVDPRLGGEPALERLITAAHEIGIRIALDFTCSHAGDGFVPYEDVKLNGKKSSYASWFLWQNDGEQLRHYGTRTDAPLFNLNDPQVRDYFLRLVRHWAARGVDALRLDAAAEVPFDFARDLNHLFKQLRPDGVLFAEFVHLHSYRFLEEDGGDAATEFGFFDTVVPFLAYGSIDAADVARRLSVIERERGGPFFRAVRFLCTHDHPRLATLARLRGRSYVIPLGFLMLFTLPGIPMMLYGEELGLYADRPEQTIEHVWPDRMPMPWSAADDDNRDEPLRELITKLTGLRRNHGALVDGELSFIHGEGNVLVYRREANGDVFDIAINAGSDETQVLLEDDVLPNAELLLSVGPAQLRGAAATLGPGGGVLVRRSAADRARQLLVAGNSALRDRDFGQAALRVKSRPSRLDFALTERCNLRCLHCITHAPEKTLMKSARQMSPWLLDQIRDDLAFAEYFAFVHGGESLVTPIFPLVLDAIRHARSGLPTMVHLLTNGLLLTASVAKDLSLRGVRSISVSLDGATADVNDAIREGARFGQVVNNLRSVVRLREEERLDLRIGISTVVMQQNISQLETLVDLCVDMGVDWLKLEEAAPATEFARRSLIRLEDALGADAIFAARRRGKEKGIVVVDHTVDRPRWRCRLDAEAAEFLESDGFANRTFIHPCRGSWEIACIESNGDIRIGDFFGPVLGNVTRAPLSSLWNCEESIRVRASAMAGRLCKQGPVTCAR